ncbi:alkanesulfonate monooxygenase SsuD/methylene tetrahydromethanopterin reductase-like flavin-dependent oxidoreductase (luciferase family) [Marmoricola sp. OAE513]|uniref:LLM class flavin-dependent oxidoreductase n=1 Tax=Marmoricola sp. OAE513 TaxID=2817894 RepID=UPI001AE3B132
MPLTDASQVRIDAVMWPDSSWPTLRQEWLDAERLGIQRGWLYDHLALSGRPAFHDAYVSLSAAAEATSTIGLGTMVTAPNFRHPATTAKAALALHEISAGRFVLGLGAGGAGVDSDAIAEPGLARADRTARFAEFVGTTSRLLKEQRVDIEGRFFAARNLDLGGGAGACPGVAVAGTGRKGMELAARHASMWITQDVVQDPRVGAPTAYEEVSRQVVILDEVLAASGRGTTVARLVVLGYGGEQPLASLESFRDCIGRYAALGFETIAVLWPRGQHAAAQRDVLEAGLAELADH